MANKLQKDNKQIYEERAQVWKKLNYMMTK